MVFLSKYLVVLNSTPSSQWSEAVRGLARARRRSTDCWKHRLAWGPAEQSLFRSLPSTFPLSPALSLISHSSIFSYVVWFSSSSLTNHLFFSLRRHLKPLFLFLFCLPIFSSLIEKLIYLYQITIWDLCHFLHYIIWLFVIFHFSNIFKYFHFLIFHFSIPLNYIYLIILHCHMISEYYFSKKNKGTLLYYETHY